MQLWKEETQNFQGLAKPQGRKLPLVSPHPSARILDLTFIFGSIDFLLLFELNNNDAFLF